MKVGTKSLLFGVHCWFLHPFFVAAAWTKLYGFPWDPRLWVAFLVHDWGYWGKPNMDGAEGETHVELGAEIMGRLFDRISLKCRECEGMGLYWDSDGGSHPEPMPALCESCARWQRFSLYHSRFYAKRDGEHFSRLCVADKLSFAMTPRWLYKIMAYASGEIHEYMDRTRDGKYARERRSAESFEKWHADLLKYMDGWIAEHKDGARDSWTQTYSGAKK